MDQQILLLANRTALWPGFSQLWGFFDSPWSALALTFGILVWAGFRKRWSRIPGALLAVAIADPLSSSLLKLFFARPRPCVDLAAILCVPYGCGHGFSMPSSHACNTFAVAAAIGAPWAWVLACLVGFSRMAIGVHYPSDVLAGALLGILVGLCSRRAWAWAMDLIGRMRAGRRAR